MLSHELRTPLTPVVVTVDALIRRTDLSQRVREGLEMIRRNVEIEIAFHRRVFSTSRASPAGNSKLCANPVDINAVIRDAIEVSRNDIEAKRAKAKTSRCSRRAAWSLADAMRLQQVIWNLLKNASKFRPNGAKDRGFLPQGDKDRVLITMDDDGIGIEADMLPRIFEAFAQGGVDVHARLRRPGPRPGHFQGNDRCARWNHHRKKPRPKSRRDLYCFASVTVVRRHRDEERCSLTRCRD